MEDGTLNSHENAKIAISIIENLVPELQTLALDQLKSIKEMQDKKASDEN